jgi:glutamyl-Q tRNA(Asp) synthetase
MTEQNCAYVGRFAPSPTGPLHLGSLVAAMASYVDARAQGGRWLLRIEDVDQPRCSIEAERIICEQLDAYGFKSDGEVIRQSERTARYENVMERLVRAKQAYACRCTRKVLEGAPRNREGETIYPGTCRTANVAMSETHTSIRCDVTAHMPVAFADRAFGLIEQNVLRDVGDFVIRRADGWYAYQLAVVVDDAEQGVTQVVRGADLLYNTPRQILLQQLLGYKTPTYLHVPIVTTDQGEKLSKQTLAPAISTAAHDVLATLHRAWQLLRQAPIDNAATVPMFWQIAAQNWRVDRLKSASSANL